ncbi:MAG: hypothetical protein ACI4NZ_03700 [Candidatus Enterousia sp.]
MKKLTAGIFAGILAIVTVNAARADIATTNYVNQNVNAKVGTLTALTTDAKDNAVDAINEVNQAAKDAAAAATAAETNAKKHADDLNSAMDARVKANKDAIDLLNGDAQTEGSVDYKITEATLDATADIKTEIQTLKSGADTVGSVANKIKTEIDKLDGNVTGSGVVKEISQENGVLTATLSAVGESDLDTELAGKINGKMNTADYNTATKMAADGTYAKKDNTVGVNLTELDKGVVAAKNAADAASTAAGNALTDAKAYTDAREEAITTAYEGYADAAETNAIDAANQNTAGLLGTGVSTTNTVTKQFETINAKVKTNADAITDITKADGTIDTKIKAAQNTLQGNIDGKVDVKTDLANKLLTTDATTGQLKEATADNKPADCGTNGVTCMLVNDGSGFKWEKIVDTYAAN